MKNIIVLTGLFIFLSLLSSAQEGHKNYILVLSVDLYMETPARILCDNFATAFNKSVIVNTISQSDSIALFTSFVSKAKYAKHNSEIDVRCKFVYELDDTHTITVCTNGRNILLDGRLIKRNKKFITFLNSVVNWHL